MIEMENPWAPEIPAPTLPARVAVSQIEQHDESCDEIAEEARVRQVVSDGRRDLYNGWKRRNTMWLCIWAPLALVSVVTLIDQLLRVTPTPAIIIAGIIGLIPFGVKLLERIDNA